ncbi:prepilin-type N-terminal cleavage/methylation domain-containing protein [Vibrio aquaticus]|uniref:Prepilin-type N-terminal cleavage/methylation domain-containing protein n=1 Tax=Vibrio aquaticus TaxID=2496559 RepID=A0A3S0MGX8_9VIBR|nr:prepilin-type N-terminal cleavage/methylation domain-containing protein [Vibrio aquaticus]RTZ14318.1 prepilin-type N-terminal cleavage/methylation domain-containing protein [Vibrio aquaticus]
MKRFGFTLIEMVITLIVGSILVLGIAGFVELGAKGYSDTIERQRLQTQAKFVLEKMSREVRHAVPNIFTSTGSCISFYPITYSGFYRVSGQDIEFIVGQNESLDPADFANLSMIINPTTQLSSANNLFAFNDFTLSQQNDRFILSGAASTLVGQSVANRQYIFDASAGGQVNYCINNARITRNDTPLSDPIVSGFLDYLPANVQMNGLVRLNLIFTQQGETTSFQQDIQVLNVP